MQKIILILGCCIAFSTSILAQKTPKTVLPKAPKLVVGIVVDQMRYDYLYRFYDKYGQGGFKRLMGQGFNCRNHHYDYSPTVTAAGHAAIFTGSVPAIDGIIGNDWFDQKAGRSMYCVEDTSVATVGSDSKAGLMSPKNLLVSTITDQLHLATNFHSKTIGIALKDRGAILPAGHTADAAYWFDSKNGSWITSTFYMNELPQWVTDFNAQKYPHKYMAQGWKPLLPLEQYTESTADNKPFETKFTGEQTPTFPHELAAQAGVNLLEVIKSTPWGNTLTKDFALATINNEKLGKGSATDFLTLSFSSTDYVGHAFGPNSIEAEDTYLRLDKDLADLLSFLDTYLGKDNVLVFLSADHGVSDVAGYWQEKKLPAGVYESTKAMDEIKVALKQQFGEGSFIKAEDNYQIYLNHALLKEKKISIDQLYTVVKEVLLARGDVADVVNLHDLGNSSLPPYQLNFVKNGYNVRRSGDLLYVLNPSWYVGRKTGTTHGVTYRYDTHVPLLWYGWKIKAGETSVRTAISDIAPTVADLLHILEPNGAIGNVITDVVK